jgi:transcriptional regulator with PAS, ATPase and Fis domain
MIKQISSYYKGIGGKLMAKLISIVAFSSAVAKFYSKQLKELFGDIVDIRIYSFEDNTIQEIEYADMFVISTYSIYETIKKYISDKSEVVVTKITISKDGFKQILDIPNGTKAMLVNLSIEMCIETISLIYHLGATNVELTPYAPGMKEVPDLNLAVTPGESRYVPQNVNETIDIGHRLLDTGTIVEIALKLKQEHLLQDNKFKNYFSSIATNNYSLEELTVKTNRLESQFDILLEILDRGIIGINSQGLIFACNKSAEKIIKAKKEDIVGSSVKELLPELPFEQVSNTFQPIESKLIKIHSIHINLSIQPVISANKFIGAFAILQKFKDTEYEQHKLRLQLLNKGHIAKYNFDNIIGESSVIVKTKEIAKKISYADSSVLIIGESGTGKELFAQAIHNNSNRKSYPFVAVNCAAIPENLLESELFGYEEGAFTGAKKGGKLGLFEFAHMGTLFLDEIGEMTLTLQAKLLRVLQEKEFVRISGNNVIKVDVRVIAATNRDLKQLVEEGKFRRDLYYRLNVLPLTIPPLRYRGEDILLLIEKFKKDLNSHFTLTTEVIDAFLNYSWDGNIRELNNYIEYLTCLSDDKITMSDLPFKLQTNKSSSNKAIEDENIDFENFKKFTENRVDEYIFVLNQLSKSHKNRTTIGRKAISKASENANIFLTEQEVRNILTNLEKFKLVKILKGRGGSKITELGLRFLNKIKVVQMEDI